jgi:anti-sigma factor ChrR (cupin superfamily)
MKPLWSDEATKRRAVLSRIEPGAQLPRHKHVGDELIYAIEGVLSDEFGAVKAGNMGYRPNGCVHAIESKTGATVLALITGGIELVTDAAASAPPSRVFTLSDLAWTEAMPGVRLKLVWADAETKRRAMLVRFEPGATLPRHKHVGDELIFLIEGANADESGEVATGNANYRPNGCVHTVTTKNGATVLAFVSGSTEPA